MAHSEIDKVKERLRFAVMGGCSAVFKPLFISDDQIAIVRVLGLWGQSTSWRLAASLAISVPSASNRLKSLWELGYLTREEFAAPSGGIEYIYKVVD
ncbi:MAG: hypothetical protein COA47_10310 [Robiginitomaculum sp.]|nr:MAG: hypothetical protein COA47_10310 [Robiginitomaculum sp.]